MKPLRRANRRLAFFLQQNCCETARVAARVITRCRRRRAASSVLGVSMPRNDAEVSSYGRGRGAGMRGRRPTVFFSTLKLTDSFRGWLKKRCEGYTIAYASTTLPSSTGERGAVDDQISRSGPALENVTNVEIGDAVLIKVGRAMRLRGVIVWAHDAKSACRGPMESDTRWQVPHR